MVIFSRLNQASTIEFCKFEILLIIISKFVDPGGASMRGTSLEVLETKSTRHLQTTLALRLKAAPVLPIIFSSQLCSLMYLTGTESASHTCSFPM